jgi:hypothetical protein
MCLEYSTRGRGNLYNKKIKLFNAEMLNLSWYYGSYPRLVDPWHQEDGFRRG